jgi:transcription elongation factor Elf1
MHDVLYQTLFKCEICGTNVPVPEPNGSEDIVLTQCDKCETEYRASFDRIARPAGWVLDCNVCGDERYVSWEAVHSKENPWRPTCDSCGGRMEIEASN